MGDSTDFGFEYYPLQPHVAPSAVFAAVFGLTFALHGYQLFRLKSWYLLPLLIGAGLEFVGYIVRCLSLQQYIDNMNPLPLGPYIIQSVFILVAPAFLAASIYMLLGRLVIAANAGPASPIPLRWLTKLFVAGDVIAFLGQAAGAGLLSAGSLSSAKTGEYIIIAGLGVQVLFFSCFIITGIIIQRRLTITHWNLHTGMPIGWVKMLYVLYIVSALILIRSLFRIIEYATGYNGYLMHQEVFLYVFDALLMSGVLILLNIYHPCRAIPCSEKISRNGNGSEAIC